MINKNRRIEEHKIKLEFCVCAHRAGSIALYRTINRIKYVMKIHDSCCCSIRH